MIRKIEHIFECKTHNGKFADMFCAESPDEAINKFRNHFKLDPTVYEEIFVEKICQA